MGDYSHEDETNIKFQARGQMKELVNSFDNMKSLDKLSEAQSKVDEVKVAHY